MSGKKWVPIVIGIILLLIVAGIALVASVAYMVSQRVHVQPVTSASGQETFDEIRARFDGQKAYIELGEDEEVAKINHDLEKNPHVTLSAIHLRVFVPRERRIVSVDLPFWMMRMMGSKPIHFRASEGGFGGLSLSVNAEDLERRGPGLVLLTGKPGHEQLLIWTE
jgi:hypothetical protein